MDDAFPKDLRQKIIAHLRRIGYLNVDYKAAIARARKERGRYECAQCLTLFPLRETHGDHVNAVIDPTTSFTDWNTFMARMFLGREQRLCKPCHKIKTKEENVVRKEKRENDKWEEIE